METKEITCCESTKDNKTYFMEYNLQQSSKIPLQHATQQLIISKTSKMAEADSGLLNVTVLCYIYLAYTSTQDDPLLSISLSSLKSSPYQILSCCPEERRSGVEIFVKTISVESG